MRFLLEFMSCCAPPNNSRTSTVKEETKSLVAPSSSSRTTGRNRNRGVKRGRTAGGRNGVAVAEWRPSLSSICEHNVFPQRNVNQVVGSSLSSSSSDRNLKRKVTSTPKTRSTPSHREDAAARRRALQVMMPAFSPAPFMF